MTFINGVNIFGGFHIRTPNHPYIESTLYTLSITLNKMGGLKWKPWIPAENDDIIYEQPLNSLNSENSVN